MRLLFALLCISQWASAQDIFDYKHTRNYAFHLFNSHSYELASSEFERLLFIKPKDSVLNFFLVKSYRKQGAITKMKSHLLDQYKYVEYVPNDLANQYVIALLEQLKTNEARDVLHLYRSINKENKEFLFVNSYLLESNWKEANREYQGVSDNPLLKPYGDIIQETTTIRRKSKAWASILSAVVPGSGKFYTGDWKDGIFSILFVGSTAYQSYRGFDKNGSKSGIGWLFASLSTGFYLGNIYGANKSAERYNKRVNERYLSQIKKLNAVHFK